MSEQTPSQKTDYEHARDALDWAFKISCQDLLGFVEGYRFDLSKNPLARKIWLRVKEAYKVILDIDIDEKMHLLPKHVLTLSYTYTLTDHQREEVEKWLVDGKLCLPVSDKKDRDDVEYIHPIDVRVDWLDKK